MQFTPILGKRLRVTRLDKCGVVPAASDENAFATTDGFISVSLSSEVEDGAEIMTKKANGMLCVNEKTDASFKRFTVEMEFCGVQPGLLSLVSNAKLYTSASAVIGFKVPEGTIDGRFAFELWTGLSGEACPEDVEEASGYMLLPFVSSGTIGDITVDGENAVTFSLTGAFTRGGNAWGTGPFDVLGTTIAPTPLPEALDPLDHLLLVETGIAPPPEADGLQAMPSAA